MRSSGAAVLELFPELAPVVPPPAGDTPSWFTPLGWWRELEQRLLTEGLIRRPFDLDPCGHPEAPVSREIRARGGAVFTEADDGLAQDWTGRTVFPNPPYDAPSMERWCPAFVRWAPRCRGLVAHVPAWVDRGWWQDWIEPLRRAGKLVVWFERGRLRYGWPGNPDGIDGDGAKFPSAIIIWPDTNSAGTSPKSSAGGSPVTSTGDSLDGGSQ